MVNYFPDSLWNIQFSYFWHSVNQQFPLITARMHSTVVGIVLVDGLPECPLLSTDTQPRLKLFYYNFIWASFIESVQGTFLIINFFQWMSKLQVKCIEYLLWMQQLLNGILLPTEYPPPPQRAYLFTPKVKTPLIG